MHMGQSMTIILQGGIIQSILDAIKRGAASTESVTNEVFREIEELKTSDQFPHKK